jgi:F-type H+-transporting ATPase subunit epsilon
MTTFTLVLQDASRSERIDGVNSFIGEDASGSFGILPDHSRMMTILVTGLAWFRIGDKNWQYLAMPGTVLYFFNNILTLSTRRYLRDDDYTRISELLREKLLTEEEQLHMTRESLRRMEESLLKRLWDLGQKSG